MFPKPSKIFLAAALVWAALALALFDTIYAWQWLHIPFHSTIETLGGVTACLIAVVLFIKSKKKLDAHLVMLATGFAGMGILDTAHAVSRPGDAFIFLHSVASLCGGFFFASVFEFYRAFRTRGRARDLLFASLVGLFGVAAFIFPFSTPWNGTWWVWHLIRFSAFTATLVYIFKTHGHNLLEKAETGRTGKDKEQEK